MSRQKAYDACTEKIARYGMSSFRVGEDGLVELIKDDNPFKVCKWILPPEAIDAIIDCAVEEAVLATKGGDKE